MEKGSGEEAKIKGSYIKFLGGRNKGEKLKNFRPPILLDYFVIGNEASNRDNPGENQLIVFACTGDVLQR